MLVIAAIILIYLGVRKRRVDFYTISLLSSLVYFSPVLVGYVWFRNRGQDVYAEIITEQYVVVALVLILSLVGAIVYDSTSYAHHKPIDSKKRPIFSRIIVGLAGASLVLFLITDFDLVQRAVKSQYGSFYVIMASSVPLALLVSVQNRAWLPIVVMILAVAVDMYGRNREVMVFSAIGLLPVLLVKFNRIRIVSYWRYILPTLIAFVFVIAYKQISAALVVGRWDLVSIRIASFDFYVMAFSQSEPFITQSLLRQALIEGWQYDGNYVYEIAGAILPFAGLFLDEFSTVSQSVNNMFYDVGYGVASNIWAEGYMVGGWTLTVMFAFAYAVVPAVLNIMFVRARFVEFRALVAIVGVLLLFFCHRAGGYYTLLLVKRLLLFYAPAYVAYQLLRPFGKRQYATRIQYHPPHHHRPQ